MIRCFYKYVMPVLLLCALMILVCVTDVRAESIKLKVIITPFLDYAPFFIAAEEGYFTEQGLEVEFVKMVNSAGAIPALLQGSLDVVAGTIRIGSLNAIARGGNIKIVAGKGYIDPTGCAYSALLIRKNRVEAGESINPEQLKGWRIAVDSRNTSEYFVEKLLKSGGLTLDDVVTRNVPHPVRLKALETGSIDAASSIEPWITRILHTGSSFLWATTNEVIPEFQYAVIFYGPTILNDNPEAGRRFMTAYLKAVRQYNHGKTKRNVEIIAKYTGLDRELLQEMCWSAIRSDGRINVSSVLDFQSWCVEKGWLDKIIPEDRFYDQSFVEYANQVAGALSE